jgi:uncharacterized membrane protein SpoIIM required for sporulation
MEHFNKVKEFAQEYPRVIFAGICIIILAILIYYYGDVYYGGISSSKEKISDIEDEVKKLIKEIYDKQKMNIKQDDF